MFKKYSTSLLIVLLMNSFCGVSVFAQSGEDKAAKQTANVKKTVAKHGVGTRVLVKLKDGTHLKGFVAEIRDDNFVVTNKKTRVATPVPYSMVKGTQYRLPPILVAVIAVGTIVGGVAVVGGLIAAGVIPDR